MKRLIPNLFKSAAVYLCSIFLSFAAVGAIGLLLHAQGVSYLYLLFGAPGLPLGYFLNKRINGLLGLAVLVIATIVVWVVSDFFFFRYIHSTATISN